MKTDKTFLTTTEQESGQWGLELYLNLEDNTASVHTRHQSNNGMSMQAWHGRALTYKLPVEFSESQFDALYTEIAPMLDEIIEHTEIVWDGSNHVGRKDARAQELAQDIEDLINELRY